MEYFTQAIVLSKTGVREYDRLFCLYTKHLGKTTVLARGARRPGSKMAGHLEPFGLLAVKIAIGRGQPLLANVETLKRYQNILKNLELIKLARHSTALVDRLVKEGSCDLGILQLLNQILELLNSPAASLPTKVFLVQVFQLQLLGHLGYRPELGQCLVCRQKLQPAGNFFDPLKGGVVCPACQAKVVDLHQARVISAPEIKLLRLALGEKLSFFAGKRVAAELATSVGAIIDSFVRVVSEK
ncbi:MAG: DNA repair protein RecO [Patescibacteria group bacterium]